MADSTQLQLGERLIGCLSDLIVTRKEQMELLKKFMNNIEKQEIVVNSAKTAATAVSVASTAALFFPPTAIFGLIGLAVSGVTGVSTTVGDLIANSVKSGTLQKVIAKSKTQEQKLQDVREELINCITRVAEEWQVDARVAQELILEFGYSGVMGLAKSGTGVFAMAATLPTSINLGLKMGDAMFNFGYGVLDAALYAGGSSTTIVVEGSQAVYQIAGSAVGSLAKAAAGVGAVINVADTIYSWATDNPNLASAKKCLANIQKSLKSLEEYQHGLKHRPRSIFQQAPLNMLKERPQIGCSGDLIVTRSEDEEREMKSMWNKKRMRLWDEADAAVTLVPPVSTCKYNNWKTDGPDFPPPA